MNEHDSELIESMLIKMDYARTENPEEASLILLNTCSIRANAAQKVYSRVGELEILKEKNPDLIIAVCGCLAESDSEFFAQKSKNVDLLIGPKKIKMLPELLNNIKTAKSTVVCTGTEEQPDFNIFHAYRQSSFQALVTIMEGCSQSCSFCIVPFVRGKAICRDSNGIVEEIKKLSEAGYKEIILLGQNVDFYIDKKAGIDFAGLLKKVAGIEPIKRVRFTSPHPQFMKYDVIDVIRDASNICEHFHLPVQSGSDKILKAMRRGYTVEKYKDIVSYIRKKIPCASITTDIIVGFPGETGDDFQETLSFMQEMEFDSAFTFKFSPRKGTPAYNLDNQLSKEEKEERLAVLNDLQDSISSKKNKEYLNKVYELLVEGAAPKNPDKLIGRTRTNKIVAFTGEKELIGSFVNVTITETKTWTLEGEKNSY